MIWLPGSGSTKICGSTDPDPQKYADPRFRIQGAKYQRQKCKTNFYSQSKSEPSKKEIIKVTLFLNGWLLQ